jgi:plastocyanin
MLIRSISRRTLVRLACLVAGATGVALLAVPSLAGAASPTVSTGGASLRFSPNVINISAGDTVTFTLGGGTHIVDLKDVSPDLTIDATHTSGTTNAFTTPGTYYYYCSIHATDAQATEAHVQANDAMVGKIVVSAAAATPTATTASQASPTAAGSATARATTSPAAPATGLGLEPGGGSGWGTVASVAGAALAVAGAGWFAVRRTIAR